MSEHVEPAAEKPPHPIGFVVTDDLARNRLTVFFRLLLSIPHWIWLAVWSIAAFFAGIAAWLVGLATGRVPDGLHAFLASFVRYGTHVYAYSLLAADPFPSFSGRPGYPVDVAVDGPAAQSRVTILFRVVLAIPALVVVYLLSNVAQLIAVAVWFYALVTGRQAKGLEDVLCYCLRFQAQTWGYVLLLTQRYPSFSDD